MSANTKKEQLIERALGPEGDSHLSRLMFWQDHHRPDHHEGDLYERLYGLPEVKAAVDPYLPSRPAAYPPAMVDKIKRACPIGGATSSQFDTKMLHEMLDHGAFGDVGILIKNLAGDAGPALLKEFRYVQSVLMAGFERTRRLVIDDYLNDQGIFSSPQSS